MQRARLFLSLNFNFQFLNIMIKNFFVVTILVVTFLSCKKESNDCQYTESSVVASASEIASLQSYVNANDPTAIQHPSGFFYKINSAGTGTVAPGLCSAVTVKYTGTLTNGSKFDENLTGVSFTLGRLILGWQKGIPLIKSGGSINLYIPPSLGYGAQDVRNNSGVVVIPANSNLVFTIQLVAVQ
jgi:FKBP-type peptidyl-prolyl cis-trans isomerase FkpA